MLILWFKSVKWFLSGMLFLLLLTSDGFSQVFTSPIQWHHSIYEARVSALGQSTAALHNGTSYHINPAIPLENGVLNFSSFLLSTSAIESPTIPDGAKLYSPSVSFSHGRFSYSAIVDYASFTIPPDLGPGIPQEYKDASNRLFRFQTGYQINDNFSVGVGISHSSYSSPIFEDSEYESGGDATAWGLSGGMHYQNQFESDRFHYVPQAGFSLNDLSNGFEYETEGPNRIHMPGQIRFGLGFSVSSKILHLNRSLYGGGIFAGFSKYLARLEVKHPNDPEELQISTPNGFKALHSTWNGFEIYGEAVPLTKQISTSVGVELHILEALYLRYGTVGGADLWIRPENGLGAEIDLFYISLAITYLNYHSSEYDHWTYGPFDRRWGPQHNSTFVQATFRVPIDGHSRDTLLSRLFNR